MNRVSPMPRGEIAYNDENRLRYAASAKRIADAELRAAVIAASDNGASVRSIADFLGLSTNTISRWKRENGSKA